MLITNAAHRQMTEKGSVRPTQFVLTMDVAKGYQRRTNLSVTQRAAQIHGFARSIVARQMTATNIAATPTPNTAMIMPRTTNARFRTALRIEARNTTVTNTLASILIALERH
ncbi:hypothetical protein NXS19_011516 [Fusarium pseudograminearum]|nr:hypothetical protein NXS19_011516 [Fusarium pseudograminearum]